MEFKLEESIAFIELQAFWGFNGVVNSKLKALGYCFSMKQGGALTEFGEVWRHTSERISHFSW